MLQAFKNGEITETQWNKFCLCCLEELCESNSAVLKRLKKNLKKHLTNNTKYAIF